MDNKQHPIL